MELNLMSCKWLKNDNNEIEKKLSLLFSHSCSIEFYNKNELVDLRNPQLDLHYRLFLVWHICRYIASFIQFGTSWYTHSHYHFLYSCQIPPIHHTPDAIQTKTDIFWKFCLNLKARFSRFHIRPPDLYSGVLAQIYDLLISNGKRAKRKEKKKSQLDQTHDLPHNKKMTPYKTIHHYTTPTCSDCNQGSWYELDSVWVSHQAWSDILTKNVRITSGRGPKISQNLFGPPSGSITYNQGS